MFSGESAVNGITPPGPHKVFSMNGQPYVQAVTHQTVTTIEFYHPQGNSLPSELLSGLAKHIHAAGLDQHTRVIVLRSAGDRAFCGGASFEELSAISDAVRGVDFFSGFGKVINAIRKCPKLVIGRIQGKCVGGGVGIAAAVDYAIAREGADIRLSELSLGFGPFVIAPAVERKIGTSAFGQLAIDATHWRNAEWARKKGLYAELHPDLESLDEAVFGLSQSLAHASPEAMTAIKQMLWKGTDHWDELMQEQAGLSGRLAITELAKAAIERVKTGRTPPKST